MRVDDVKHPGNTGVVKRVYQHSIVVVRDKSGTEIQCHPYGEFIPLTDTKVVAEKKLNTYTAYYCIVGRACATIKAESLEVARELARNFDVSGELIEWEYDTLDDVEEN